MQKLSGSGTVFLEIDGSTVEYELEKGQQMVIDTGYLAMMDATVTMEVQQIKGFKNVLMGGEGQPQPMAASVPSEKLAEPSPVEMHDEEPEPKAEEKMMAMMSSARLNLVLFFIVGCSFLLVWLVAWLLVGCGLKKMRVRQILRSG